MIIDIHNHFNIGSSFDCPETNIHKRNLPFLLQDYDNCGISVVLFRPILPFYKMVKMVFMRTTNTYFNLQTRPREFINGWFLILNKKNYSLKSKN